MRKDIKQLTKDIEDAILMGKSIAASEIHFTLQHRSPFWTGTFNRSWKVQKGSPVAAVKPREGDPEEQASGKLPTKGELIPTELNEDLYIGNQVKYAAFVINEKKHPDDETMYVVVRFHPSNSLRQRCVTVFVLHVDVTSLITEQQLSTER